MMISNDDGDDNDDDNDNDNDNVMYDDSTFNILPDAGIFV
jgi:hypothetical protein